MKQLLPLGLALLLSLSACATPGSTATKETLHSSAQILLVGPLSQALDSALVYAQQARSPEEAKQLASSRFMSELGRMLQRQLSAKDVQLQTQAQWSANGKIQIQLQAQISDNNLTAQAQRQALFAPPR